jgi:hypothetical protein
MQGKLFPMSPATMMNTVASATMDSDRHDDYFFFLCFFLPFVSLCPSASTALFISADRTPCTCTLTRDSQELNAFSQSGKNFTHVSHVTSSFTCVIVPSITSDYPN